MVRLLYLLHIVFVVNECSLPFEMYNYDFLGESTNHTNDFQKGAGYYAYDGAYGNTVTIIRTIAEVAAIMRKDNLTQTYLATFNDTFLRKIVSTQLQQCPYISLCRHDLRLGEFPNESESMKQYQCCDTCSCNSTECLRDGTCCPDVTDENTGKYIFEHSSKTSSDTSKPVEYCIPLRLTEEYEPVGISAIVNCLEKWMSTEMDQKCQRVYTSNLTSIYDILPCRSSITLTTYRNKYCALCNGVSEQDIEYFDVKLIDYRKSSTQPTAKDLIALSLTYEEFLIEFIPLENVTKCKVLVDRCNVTGGWETYDKDLEFACSMYTSTLHDDIKLTYRNVFCAKCNGAHLTDVRCYLKAIAPGSHYGLSGLLKLDVLLDSREQEYHVDKRCEENQIYDGIQVSTSKHS